MKTISQLTLALLGIEWIILIIILIGVYFAIKKNYSMHHNVMTATGIVQLLLVLVMIFKFLDGTNYPSIIYIHMTLGSIISLFILYTILVMNNLLPKSLNISESKQKLLMRITAILWIIAVFAGTGIFFIVYIL